MKKLYISIFIIAILSISLVAAASSGWSIKNLFTGKAQATTSVANEASCTQQVAQNRQLILLVMDHLGIVPPVEVPPNSMRGVTGKVIDDYSKPVTRGVPDMRRTTKQARIDTAFTPTQKEQIRGWAATADLQGLSARDLGSVVEEVENGVEFTDEPATCRLGCTLSGCTDGHQTAEGCSCGGCGDVQGYGASVDDIGLSGLTTEQLEQMRNLAQYAQIRGIHAQELANYVAQTAQRHLRLLDDDQNCAYACQLASCTNGVRDSTAGCICIACTGLGDAPFDEAVRHVGSLGVTNVKAISGVPVDYYAPGQ